MHHPARDTQIITAEKDLKVEDTESIEESQNLTDRSEFRIHKGSQNVQSTQKTSPKVAEDNRINFTIGQEKFKTVSQEKTKGKHIGWLTI